MSIECVMTTTGLYVYTRFNCNWEFPSLVRTYKWFTPQLMYVLIYFQVANEQSNHFNQCRFNEGNAFVSEWM